MLKRIARCALAGVLALSLCPVVAFAESPSRSWSNDIDVMVAQGGYIEGQAIVGIDAGTDGQFDLMRALFGSVVDNAVNLAEVDAGAVADVSRPTGDTVRLALVSEASMTTEQLLHKLADEQSVVFAEPNYTIGLADEGSETNRSSAMGEADVLGQDNYTYLQWAYGDANGCNPPAWNTSAGNMGAPVVVAVLDSGVDGAHPDLQGSLFQFSEEQKSRLGCGDYGFNALANGGPSVGDAIGHGTQVAGTIAAQWNNFGVSGIASDADIVPVRVVSDAGTESIASVLRGYRFVKDAVDAGVPVSVVNNSWATPASSRAVDAVSRDLGANSSVFSVFAAGNDAVNLDSTAILSSKNPYAVKVAASDSASNLCAESSYGAEQVALGAPGAAILSTTSSSYAGDPADTGYIATDGKGAYNTASGTSYAAAVTSGAAAVLAADYRTSTGKLPTALELGHRITSHVRHQPAFSGNVRGNGVLDLSTVAQSLSTQAGEAPSISSVSVSGDEVTVTGSNFGATQGTDSALEVHAGGLGDDSAAVAYDASSISWSDTEITFTLDEEPAGIIDVVVSTGVGDPARGSTFVSAGAGVYEKSLAKPKDYLPASASQLGSGGILKGWGRYLYYLPETPVSSDGKFAYHVLERYDIDTKEWTELASPDDWLVYCSAVMFGGNLVVAGVVYDTATGEPTTTEKVYMYDIENDAWETLESEGVNLGASVTNLDDLLVFVGGADTSWNLSDEVVMYDTSVGVVAPLATLATPAFNPQLAVHHSSSLADSEGQIYVYSYGDTYSEFTGTSPADQHLQVVVDGDVEEIGNVFPSFLETSTSSDMPARATLFGSLAAANEGLMLVGPPAADGSTDTYLLDWTDASEFLPYYKRASDAQLYAPAACIHDEFLYAAAQSKVERHQGVFRATELLAPVVADGNYQVWRKGSKKGLSIAYTPDLSRYFDDVYIDDDQALGVSLDPEHYSYDAGSKDLSGDTVITLEPEYLETLAVGKHTETVCFDGKDGDGIGATVTAHFTIEKKADPMPPTPDPDPDPTPDPDPDPTPDPKPSGNDDINGGNAGNTGVRGTGASGASSTTTNTASSTRPAAASSTRPAALAMTGDAMLIVPFVVIGVGAIGLGVYLIRRRSHNR